MNEDKQLFYATCSDILGIEHEWHNPVPRRTRWNNRFLGNGRYPGFGVVQCFGATGVRVISRHGTKIFKTHDDTYEYLRGLPSI